MGVTWSARALAQPTRIARVALPVVGAYLAAYVATRHFVDALWSHALAQVLFLVPLIASSILLARCATRSPARSRSRRVWLMLAAASSALLVGEVAWSYAQVFLAAGPGALGVVFDVASGVAMVCIAAAIGLNVGIDRFGWPRALRLVLDTLALAALAFGLLYRFWATQHADATDPLDAARLALYGVIALLLCAGGWVSFGRRSARSLPHNALIALAIGLIALGVAFWAGGGLEWELGVRFADIASGVALLAAYCTLAIAGWTRLRDPDAMRSAPVPAAPRPVWPGVVVSGSVFVAVVWLGLLAIGSPPGTDAAAVYLYAAFVAVVCAVGRTALASAEAEELSERSLSDPLTRTRGPRAFGGDLDRVLAAAKAAGGQVALYSVDLDDFARVNARFGYRSGDRCLVAVARVLESLFGRAAVFRLSGDEFVAVAASGELLDTRRTARAILAAVRSAECEASVTASVGVALYPDDATEGMGLLRNARLASLWAKRHGKDRVVRYEERIGDTLAFDERLARPGDRARMDMARALLAAADARDPANHWHARNVAALVRLLAEDLGLEPAHVDRVEMAAILHDVGKIALPDVMLGGRTLTFQERVVAREHARLGERLVESLAEEGVGRWVRGHHENWDGSGYPDGLTGDAIPLECRIIALADAYDGMTMGKRYGAPMSKAAALQEIDLGIGVRFDPDLAERFIKVVGSTGALGWSDEWPSA